MEIWLLNLIPKSFMGLLAPASLIAIGLLVEKYYSGRISMFSNAIALIIYFNNFKNLPYLLILYINLATILGLIGFISYIFKFRLFEIYYKSTILFSSLITGIILLWGAIYLI